VQVGNNSAAAVEVGANSAEAVEGEVMAVEDEATTLVDTCKENMVDVVRIFWGLREERWEMWYGVVPVWC
jgi:hypothetical protein